MRIWSESFEHRGRIPAEFAMGTPDGFGGNRNPHLTWDDVPANTRSFALLCIDTDAPTDGSTVGRDDMDIPVEQPRADFVHWAMADMPATTHSIAAGASSDGISIKGKLDPPGPSGGLRGQPRQQCRAAHPVRGPQPVVSQAARVVQGRAQKAADPDPGLRSRRLRAAAARKPRS